jgi:hypothetical protein
MHAMQVDSGRPDGDLQFDFSSQTVKDPFEAQRFYLRHGLRNLIRFPLIGLAVSGVAFLIFYGLDQFMERDLPGPVEFVVSLIWALAFLWAVVNFPLWTYWGIRSFLVSARPANLRRPEAAVRAFLASVNNSLYERGFNMLTDQARTLGPVQLPRVHQMAKRMPEADIHDLESFRNFWSAVEFLDWKFKLRRASREDLGDRVVRLTVPVKADAAKGDGKIHFRVDFMLVERERFWFLTHGFAWPRA